MKETDAEAFENPAAARIAHESGHGKTAGPEAFGQMASDESGGSGDQNVFHRFESVVQPDVPVKSSVQGVDRKKE
jgi:hypothetical protein